MSPPSFRLNGKATNHVRLLLTAEVLDKCRQSEVPAVIEEISKQLRHPFSKLRQYLLLMFKVKNIRVVTYGRQPDTLTLDITYGDGKCSKYLIECCTNGQIDAMFNECVTSPSCTDVSIHCCIPKQDMEGYKNCNRETHQEKDLTTDDLKRYYILTKLVNEIISKHSRHQAFDLYRYLKHHEDKMIMKVLRNQSGHNILHMTVLSGRKEFLSVIFYSNIWQDLRSEVIDPALDDQWGGYTAYGMAERLLFHQKGSSILGELEFFDDLWSSMTNLHVACLRGDLSEVRQLYGGNGGQDGCVLYACASGNVDLVAYLVEKGADPTDVNERGENGLLLAAKFGNSAVVRYLLGGFRFGRDDEDRDGLRAVDYPAVNGDTATLEAFQNGGMPPDGRSLAEAAGRLRHLVVDNLIRQYNVDIGGRDKLGRTALLNAAANGDRKLVKILLDHGADLLDADRAQRNCLHLAAEANDRRTLELLVEAATERGVILRLIDAGMCLDQSGQSVIVRGWDQGRPAWHRVIPRRSRLHLFEEKLRSGQVDVKQFGTIIRSGFGPVPEGEQLAELDNSMAENLNRSLPDLTPLAQAIYLDHTDAALLLIENGADPNITDLFGNTPLHLAAMRGNMLLVQRIAERMTNPDQRNNEGETPTDVAVSNGHLNVRNYFDGVKWLKYAKEFEDVVTELGTFLDAERMDSIRRAGGDLRLYVIDIIRQLEMNNKRLLLDVGSGPITKDSHHTLTDKREAFAGT